MNLMLEDPPSMRQRGYKGSYGDAVNRITRCIQNPVELYYLIVLGSDTCLAESKRALDSSTITN